MIFRCLPKDPDYKYDEIVKNFLGYRCTDFSEVYISCSQNIRNYELAEKVISFSWPSRVDKGFDHLCFEGDNWQELTERAYIGIKERLHDKLQLG